MTAMIDVIIPAYNAAPFIKKTLDSLLDQDNLIAKVIVVNDGSTDHTADCVLEFSKEHPELLIELIHQKNGGLSSARNAGIGCSQSEYIAFLDADDLWLPHKLTQQLALFQKPHSAQLGLVYCGYQLIDQGDDPLPQNQQTVITPKLRGNVYQALLRGNFISGSGSGVLIKRSALDAVGYFDEQLHACEDWDMWLRLSRHHDFDFSDQVLLQIRVHANNMQKDAMRMINAELMVLNKFSEQGLENPFLLWKLRTYLLNKGVHASSIPGFKNCKPELQAQLTGWRMHVASALLTPVQMLANYYLNHKR